MITHASNVSDLGLELIYPIAERFASFASRSHSMEGTAHTNSISILSPIQQQQQQQQQQHANIHSYDNHYHQHRFPSSEVQGKEP